MWDRNGVDLDRSESGGESGWNTGRRNCKEDILYKKKITFNKRVKKENTFKCILRKKLKSAKVIILDFKFLEHIFSKGNIMDVNLLNV